MVRLNAVYLYQFPANVCAHIVLKCHYYYVIKLRNVAQRPASGSTIGTYQQQGQHKVSPDVKLQLSEQCMCLCVMRYSRLTLMHGYEEYKCCMSSRAIKHSNLPTVHVEIDLRDQAVRLWEQIRMKQADSCVLLKISLCWLHNNFYIFITVAQHAHQLRTF